MKFALLVIVVVVLVTSALARGPPGPPSGPHGPPPMSTGNSTSESGTGDRSSIFDRNARSVSQPSIHRRPPQPTSPSSE